MEFPQQLSYTRDHEWIQIDQDRARIGITDFAQRELGDIVFVEVKAAGTQLEAGDIFGTIEAVKTVSDLFIPVPGVIAVVNPKLSNEPELVNTDPYGEGWIIEIHFTNFGDLAGLMDAVSYRAMVE